MMRQVVQTIRPWMGTVSPPHAGQMLSAVAVGVEGRRPFEGRFGWLFVIA